VLSNKIFILLLVYLVSQIFLARSSAPSPLLLLVKVQPRRVWSGAKIILFLLLLSATRSEVALRPVRLSEVERGANCFYNISLLSKHRRV
jgi:hypothetical protein